MLEHGTSMCRRAWGLRDQHGDLMTRIQEAADRQVAVLAAREQYAVFMAMHQDGQ
jgi:hypothetical protein